MANIPNLTFTPAANANGSPYTTFTFQVEDDGGGANLDLSPNTIRFDVTAVNDLPVANADSYTTNEDTVLNVNVASGVLANDTDVENSPLTAVKVTDPANGTLALNANGSFTYTPNLNFNGSDSFTYQANDGTGSGNVATVSITVNPVNDAPTFTKGADVTVAEDSGAFTQANWATAFSPGPANESAQTVLAYLVSNSNNGLFSTQPAIATNGTLSFTPAANANGSATVTVRVQDNGGTASGGVDTSAAQTFTISVTPVNDPPTGTDKTISMLSNTSYTFAAADFGFSDPNDSPANAFLQVKITTLPGAGSLKLSGSTFLAGTLITVANIPNLTFTPAAGASGTPYASFTFQVQDDGGTAGGGVDLDQSPNTITFNVTAQQADLSLSKAVDNSVPNLNTNVIFTITVTNAGPNTATNIAVTDVLPAGLAFVSSDDAAYDPAASDNIWNIASLANGASATLHITAKVTSGGMKTNTATLSADQADPTPPPPASVNVTPVSSPVASDDSYSTNEDTPLTIAAPGVLGNDAGAGALSAIKVTDPAHGTVTLNADGSFTYTPAANYNGPDSFTYKANDTFADSNVATVNITVNPVNDPPVANDDSYCTNEDTPLTIGAPGVLSDDTDIDGGALSAIKVTDPAHGTVTLNADGSFTYTPAANYNGPDSFTYKANDTFADSNVATVNITVNPVNDPPVANDDSYSTNEDTPLTVNAAGVLSNDTDIDGGALSAIKVTDPAHGTVTLNADGSFTYTPAANYNGPDSFTYKANDGTADSNIATVNITVNPVNDPPVANDDSYSTNEDTPLTINAAGVLSNDTDIDGGALSAIKMTDPAHGTVTLNADGSFIYTPAANYNGPDSFTYKVNDGTADSNIATVNITVNPVNDPPVANDDSYSTNEDTPLTINAAGVLSNDTDIDGGALSAIKVTDPAHGTVALNADGSFTYTPAANYNGPDSFTYKANDTFADSNVATVNITVNPVNDPPVGSDKTITIATNTTYTFGASDFGFSDPSDAPPNNFMAVEITTLPGAGSLALSGVPVIAGDFIPIASISNLTFTPAAGASGSPYASLTFQVQDDGGTASGGLDLDQSPNTFSINVSAEQADLSLSKTVDNPTPNLGSNVLFTITVSNAGPDAATNIAVTDVLPVGLAFMSSDDATYDPSAPDNVWDIASLASGASVSLHITATVTGTSAITNTASLTADQPDPTPPQPASVSLTPAYADLSLSKTVDNATPNLGSNVLFTITVSNAGPDAATNIAVTDVLPAGLSFVSSDDATYDPSAPDNIWNIPSLASGSSAALHITATVTGTSALTNTATLTADQPDPTPPQPAAVTLTPVIPPDAADDAYTVAHDTDLNVAAPGVLSNDTLNGGAISGHTDPANGSLVAWNADGSFVYRPTAGFYGSDSFQYTLSNTGFNSTATVSITVTPPAPVAVDDSYSVDQSTTLNVPAAGVLTNDTLNGAVISSHSDPVNGSLVLNADGSFDYTPTPGYTGPDSFTYTITNATAFSKATVNITVSPPLPPAPVAVDDAYSVAQDALLDVPDPGTLGNDTLNGATISADTNPLHGSLFFNADGSFVYAPAAEYTGPDSFTYTLTNAAASSTATVALTVNPSPPVAVDNAYAILYDSVLNVPAPGVLSNDTLRGAVITANTTPANGTLTFKVDGSFSYKPVAGFTGTDSFTYTLTNAVGSSTATVSITVNLTPPLAVDDAYSVVQGTVLNVPAPGILANDSLGGATTVVVVANAAPEASSRAHAVATLQSNTPPAHGVLTLHADGSLSYAPDAGYVGLDLFTYTLVNAVGSSTATVRITITPLGQANLSIAKTVNNPTPNVGQNVTYTITVQNAGPATATNVQVTDLLPDGVALVASTATQGTYNAASGLWNVGSIPVGASKQLLVVVRALVASHIINVAQITHSDQFDPTLNDQIASVAIDPLQSDLSLTISVEVSFKDAIGYATYTLTLTNRGPSTATRVVVTDKLPPNLTFVYSDGSQGTYDSATGLWTIGTVASGGSATLRITTRMPADASTPVVNSAEVTGVDQPDPNSTPANGQPTEDDQSSVTTSSFLPASPGQNPGPGQSLPLHTACFGVRFDFANAKNDSLIFLADFAAPAGFSPAGQSLALNLAGYTLTCPLDSKGRYRAAGTAVQAKMRNGRLVVNARVYRADLQSHMKAAVNRDVAPTPVANTILLVQVGAQAYGSQLTPVYQAKQNRYGKFYDLGK
ncbi:MAG TPA: Ig-like domain-containing protein [Planctomycetota bacterium]